MKRIWILEHYSAPETLGHFTRQTNFCKYLTRMGYEVLIFSASTIHNSELNVTEPGKPYVVREYPDGVRFVHIRCRPYKGNGMARILNMLDFYFGLKKAVRDFEKPDVIYASMPHFFTCVRGLQLAKRYRIPCVCEARDLWPESFVAYGIVGSHNPVLWLLYGLEKWIYKKADALVFTWAGGGKYISDKGWSRAQGGPVDMEKIFYINNGVDLALFDEQCAAYPADDPDLCDPSKIKLVYTGSIRAVNNLGIIVEAADILRAQGRENKASFIIYGDGDERETLQSDCTARGLGNVLFKGRTEKKKIPGITRKADVCLLHNTSTSLNQYGQSQNKFFEYMASGHGILQTYPTAYSPIVEKHCGIMLETQSASAIADAVEDILEGRYDLAKMGENAREAAEDYDFCVLTEKMVKAMEYALHEKA